MKKILISFVALIAFSNVWALDLEDIEKTKVSYSALDEEAKSGLKKSLRESGWTVIGTGNEFKAFMHYDFIKPISDEITEAWVKYVVINDISKDGLSLGDFSMYLIRYNCADQTYKTISTTDYNQKNGKLINSNTFPSTDSYKAVVPDTLVAKQIRDVCFVQYIKTH